MSSRLIKDLEARALQARTDDERLQIRAERAGALARLGRLDAARQEIAELRRLNSSFRPALAAWILFTEGQIEHFESLSPSAHDKFNRAYAIGVSLGDPRLQSEAAAWVAICEFQKGDLTRAAMKACEAIENSSSSDHSTLTRAHLVLADCYNGAGDLNLAKRHYSVARQHAVAAGDLTMQSAILYNQAADSLSRLSLTTAVGLTPREDPRQVALEVQSVLNLDSGAGIKSLAVLNSTLSAQLAVAQGDWAEGYATYSACLEDACANGQERWRAKFLAERGLCASKLGHTDRALSDLTAALESIASCSDDDDLAIAHGRIASAFLTLEDPSKAELHARLAQHHLELYAADQRQLIDSLPLSPLDKKEPG